MGALHASIGPLANPAGEEIRFPGAGHLAIRRHVPIQHHAEQEALFRVSWNQCRSGFTASAEMVAAVESQAALDLSRSPRMAFVTGLDQHRANAFFKQLQSRSVIRMADSARGDDQASGEADPDWPVHMYGNIARHGGHDPCVRNSSIEMTEV